MKVSTFLKPTRMKSKKCKICKTAIIGRADKMFCSVKCKNHYHIKLRQVTKNSSSGLDRHLHRNWSILLEILGKNQKRAKIPRILLEEKKFQFKYLTHFYNSKGKTIHYVYDIAWIAYADDEVLIFRTDFSEAKAA